jgi:hypothetical protein
MTHLLCAKILLPDAPTAFFVGSISPDCIDERAFKDHTHFRDLPESERLGALRKMARELDMSDPYQFGAVYHLFADYTWDLGPQADHRRQYKGDDWFHDYRFAINECGREIYMRYPWAKELWEDMAALDESEYAAIPEYPTDRIKSFILRGKKRSEEPITKPSEFFTPALVDAYCAETAELFSDYLKTI